MSCENPEVFRIIWKALFQIHLVFEFSIYVELLHLQRGKDEKSK